MFREEVAEHYRQKGYRLRESVKVRGESGSVHACQMVAQGPLGNLVIAFGDEGGLEGPELHAIHRTARDIGATPVVAAEHVADSLRQVAQRANVVVLDRQAMEAPPPSMPDPSPEPDYPPWPDPSGPRHDDRDVAWPGAKPRRTGGLAPRDIDDVVEDSLRSGPVITRKVDPGIWKYPRQDAVAVTATGTAALVEPEPVPEPPTEEDGFAWLPRERATDAPARDVAVDVEAGPRREALLSLRVVLIVLLAGAAAGAAFWGLQSFL